MRLRLLAVAFATALCGPAFAGDGACFWGQLPAATQDQLLVAYGRSGRQGLSALLKPDQALERAVRVCAPDAMADRARLQAAFMALIFDAIERAASYDLEQRREIAPGALNRAWGRLSAQERQVLRDGAARIESGESGEEGEASAMLDVVIKAASMARGKEVSVDEVPQPAFKPYLEYFSSRAGREVMETRF